MTAQAAAQISDLQFTEAYRVPFQYSRLVREHLGAGAFVQSSAGVTVTDLDGNVVLRPDRLLRRQHLRQRLLQGMHRAGRDARACARPGARALPSRHRRQRRAAVRDFRARRGLVPHVRHRSGDAGGAARPLSHPPLASGSLCRRLSRLVGRRAARRRQSDLAARDLYAGRNVGADAARAEDAARHRLRAGQSAAGAAPQRQCAGQFGAGRQLAQRPLRSRRLYRVAEGAARRSAPSATSC